MKRTSTVGGQNGNVKTGTSEKLTLRPRETCRLTGFGVTQTYRMLKNGTMPSIRVGKQFYIPKAALVKWLESCGERVA
jgi:excisionase family DNA binding protein